MRTMIGIRALGIGLLVGTALLLLPCTPASAQTPSVTLESAAFADGEPIPLRNSAYGENLSPPLSWSGVPQGTRSFVLVMADIDVPMPNGFVHWLVYDIPADARELPEGIPSDPLTLSSPPELAGTTQGLMGMRNPGYFGPRPPAGSGPHRYVFTLYALGGDVELAEGLSRDEVMEAIEPHIIGEGEITGIYEQAGN